MAIKYIDESNKVQKITTAGKAVSTGVSKKTPINMKKVQTGEDQSNEIIDYINSDEFKNLSKDEQIKKLKEQFPALKDLNDSEIQSYINSIKTAQTDDESAAVQDAEPTGTGENESELEALAKKYGDNIDEVIASIKSKQCSKDEVSAEELRILELYSEKSKTVIPMETLVSKVFQNYTPEQQMEYITKSYLEQDDANYAQLSDEEKQSYLADKIADLKNLVSDDSNTSEYKEKTEVLRALVLLQTAHSQNISVDDFKNMDSETLNKKITEGENLAIKQVINLVDENTRTQTSYKDKVDLYTDAVLKLTDAEYNSITDEKERQQYRSQKINEFITEQLGVEEWDTLDEKTKQSIMQRAAVSISSIVNDTAADEASIVDKLKSYKDMPQYDRNKADLAYLQQQQPQTEEIKTLIANIEDEQEVLSRLQEKGIDNPSMDDLIAELETMEKEGILSEYLNEKKVYFEKCKELGISDTFKRNNTDEATLRNTDLETLIKTQFKDINKDNIQEYENAIQEFVKNTNGSKEELEALTNYLKSQGIAEDVINKYMQDAETTAKCFANAQNADEFNFATERAAKGSEDDAKYANIANYEVSEWFDDKDELTKIGVVTVQYTRFQKSFSQGLHDHQTKETNVYIFKGITSSENVSDSAKASFTNTFIITAANDSDKVYYAKEFSAINDTAVIEGLAAASQSISDSDAKSEYNSYVETAAKNYSAEIQAAIKTALQTGEVSQETLSKTTVSTSVSSTSATSNAAATATSASSSTAKNTTYTLSTTAATTYSTVSTATPAVSLVSNNAATVYSISAAQTTSTDETERLEQLKQDAMNNAKETEEKIKKSTAEYEAEKSSNKTDSTDETDETSETDDTAETVNEVIEELEITDEDIKQELIDAYNRGDYTAVYNYIVTNGYEKILLDRLGSSSSFVINSFIKSINSDSFIEDLYIRCSSETVRKELLNNLSEERIYSLIASGKIQNLNDISDYKIIESYVLKNIAIMSSTTFNMYLSYLPGDVRESLQEKFNELNGIKNNSSAETQYAQQDYANDEISKNTAAAIQPATNPSSKAHLFADNEIQKTLNDGRVVRRKETFAGISNTVDDDSFEDITETAMNDQVLTPGSDAWREKYNRYEFCSSFGSTKVRMGQKITKKFNFNNLEYLA